MRRAPPIAREVLGIISCGRHAPPSSPERRGYEALRACSLGVVGEGDRALDLKRLPPHPAPTRRQAAKSAQSSPDGREEISRSSARSSPNRRGNQIGKHTSELQSLMRIPYAVFCL